LQTLRRRREAQRAKVAEEDMGGKSPLARFGVDIEAVDNDGKTALHRAAMFSDTDKVRQGGCMYDRTSTSQVMSCQDCSLKPSASKHDRLVMNPSSKSPVVQLCKVDGKM
jgi:ankyrin repeat protein